MQADVAALRKVVQERGERVRVSGGGDEVVMVDEDEQLGPSPPTAGAQLIGGHIRAGQPGKDVAEVHDYHDRAVPIIAASLLRRMPGYRALGFVQTRPSS